MKTLNHKQQGIKLRQNNKKLHRNILIERVSEECGISTDEAESFLEVLLGIFRTARQEGKLIEINELETLREFDILSG